MSRATQILLLVLLLILLLPLLIFCAFGFLSSFEPGVSGAIAWRVGYAAVAVTATGGAAALARRILRRTDGSHPT